MQRMRSPFENANILATGPIADVEKNAPPWDPTIMGLGQNVATTNGLNYGKGRCLSFNLWHLIIRWSVQDL